MSRMADLEARRRALMARCEAQRLELAQRVAQLHAEPESAQGTAAARGPSRYARHPLAWVVALAGLTLLGRPREVLALLGWLRTGLSLASRVAQLLSLLSLMRGSATGAATAPSPATPSDPADRPARLKI